MMNGTIKKLVADKKFGFIRGNGGMEYFFHRDDFQGDWDDLVMRYHKNDTLNVNFHEVDSMKGPRAGNVMLGGPF